MALGDGIRRNIAHVEPSERALVRDAFLELNRRFFPGTRTDSPPGGVTWWFKQDEIHQATHVHGGPEFLPWHREIVNRLEAMLREINPQLSLHYWDWTQDPRSIPNANLGGGTTGTLNLFTADFMGYGGATPEVIGPPWQNAAAPWRSDGYYVPDAANYRSTDPFDLVNNNPADPPREVARFVAGSPASSAADNSVLNASDYPGMRGLLENTHNAMHGFVAMGGQHISFRDPFVFLLHSNVDRLFAMWQTALGHPERLDPNAVYGSEGVAPSVLDNNIEPWSGTPPTTRPWAPPENEGVPKNYKHLSVVTPPCYDTLPTFPATLTPETPNINFNDVPEGETAARAVVFSAVSCHEVHLSITAGPTVLTGPPGTAFGTFPTLGTSVSIPHISSSIPPRGRLWISYKGTAAGDVATGTVTIHCAETNQDFVVPIAANTITRPTVATMLVLDQSGSMDWLAGVDATTKRIDVLHQAAGTFVQLVQRYPGDGVGMVSFDHNAYPGAPVTQYSGGPFDLLPVQNAIQGLHPQGATSIGGGLALGRNTLNPVTGYDHKALIVFTDGLENTAPYIADVMSSINDRTFAIGLGTAQQVSTAALSALTNGTGGYLLLSGILSPAIDDTFRLAKYFLQILAGVTNNNIVTDPAGYLAPGMTARIPFQLNEADIDATVILLTDLPVVRLLVETPDGDIMDAAAAAAIGAVYEDGPGVSFYRFTLPLPLGGSPAQSGTWHALLDIDRKVDQPLTHLPERSVAAWSARAAHGVRYCVTVQSHSNLRMDARLSQTGMVAGSTITIRATLSEYGIPVAHRAFVRADLERPDGTQLTLVLAEIEDGVFDASTTASLDGVYRFHLFATGRTLRGLPFTRERLLTASVFPGGNNPWPTSDPSKGSVIPRLCDLLNCLLDQTALRRFLEERHLDINAIHRCLDQWCKEGATFSDEELREREGTLATKHALEVSPGALTPQVLETLTRILKGRRSTVDAKAEKARAADSEDKC
jgi:tyrosinase-like protein/VWA domain-containing protein